MKKILWKSDLWSITVTFGVMTLCCLAYLILHLVRGENGEAFAMGIVTAIPATITLFCAFTDRGEAKMVWVHPQVEEDMLERGGVLEASCLNPDNPVNSDRIARLCDKTRPPDIG